MKDKREMEINKGGREVERKRKRGQKERAEREGER
jgi:hypothetical protein